MLFNSIDFAFFLPIVFILYWYVVHKNVRWQNVFIVVASYFFYGWWDWRFLSLIVGSTLLDYGLGIALGEQKNITQRKVLLWTSIVLNLGVLGVFKYYNFFLDNLSVAFSFFGATLKGESLQLILPIGISFYTFQTLSYTIDVYRRTLEPTKDLVAFAAFVSFFPQLVAGPIERATNLLPQFHKNRTFDYSKAVDGMRQILWGLFKKVVIADNCAIYANMIFNHSEDYTGSTLVLGALFFTFQIYGDFSGYSDMAIGTARLFGFELMQNFNFPYFSRNMAEFWRRWHISLSTWFRDYVYVPLGGSLGGTWMKVRNIFVVFLLSGFWHGANWTFIAWGALNAFYFLPLLLTNNNRTYLNTVAAGRKTPSMKEFSSMVLTFGLTVLAWVFFRANNIEHALRYISEIASPSLFTMPQFEGMGEAFTTILLVACFIFVEWKGREGKHALESMGKKWNPYLRYIAYYVLIVSICWFGAKEQQFIYFQF